MTDKTECSIVECNKLAVTRGWCPMHYARWRRHGSTDILRHQQPADGKCTVINCDKQSKTLGLCAGHYSQWYRGQDLDMLVPLRAYKYREAGQPGRAKRSGKGYMYCYFPEHSNASKDGYLGQHVIVMSESLGRALYPGEEVHHKNGVKDDNRLENLELWSKSHPHGQRVEDKVAWAWEIIDRYDPDHKQYS